MKVKDVMMRTPAYCRPETNLGAAVELLWNRNCGMLPIVNNEEKVVGVVTDRDLCIALGTRNRLPGEITVGEIATGKLYFSMPEDDIRVALKTMANQKVRRLPIVNTEGKLQGILSMDDIVLHADSGAVAPAGAISHGDIVHALRSIYHPWVPQTLETRIPVTAAA